MLSSFGFLWLLFLNQDGWSGRLLYTTSAGSWEDIKFSPALSCGSKDGGFPRGCGTLEEAATIRLDGHRQAAGSGDGKTLPWPLAHVGADWEVDGAAHALDEPVAPVASRPDSKSYSLS